MNSYTPMLLVCIAMAAGACNSDPVDDDLLDGVERLPTSSGALALPAPLPGLPVPWQYTWSENGSIFDFDGYTAYAVNLVDATALELVIPGVLPGDTLTVEADGIAYSDHPLEDDAHCILQAFITESGVERTIDVGGSATFVLGADMRAEREVVLAGSARTTGASSARVRILGRASRPDRFCGLSGAVSLSVTHGR